MSVECLDGSMGSGKVGGGGADHMDHSLFVSWAERAHEGLRARGGHRSGGVLCYEDGQK